LVRSLTGLQVLHLHIRHDSSCHRLYIPGLPQAKVDSIRDIIFEELLNLQILPLRGVTVVWQKHYKIDANSKDWNHTRNREWAEIFKQRFLDPRGLDVWQEYKDRLKPNARARRNQGWSVKSGMCVDVGTGQDVWNGGSGGLKKKAGRFKSAFIFTSVTNMASTVVVLTAKGDNAKVKRMINVIDLFLYSIMNISLFDSFTHFRLIKCLLLSIIAMSEHILLMLEVLKAEREFLQ
jgi:hypothetical protein